MNETLARLHREFSAAANNATNLVDTFFWPAEVNPDDVIDALANLAALCVKLEGAIADASKEVQA